jgi:hypothetical protein
MPLHWPAKDPNEAADYDLDWTGRLDVGDTISSSTWICVGSPASITLVSVSGFSAALNLTKLVLSGGTPNQIYEFRNTIVTAQGATLSRSASLLIKAQ